MPAYVECSFLITIPIQVNINTKLAPPPAVLITGSSTSSTNTAELFLPSTGTSCILPHVHRLLHTADNNILCGGSSSSNNCLQWSPDTGTWEELVTLDVRRQSHVSWTPGNGVGTYLMGGAEEPKTSSLIKPDGGQETGFQLKYDTKC